MKTVLPDSQESLVQWISQATGISTFGVKVRLRGNDLHILCESVDCPQRWHTLSDLLQALQQTDLDVLTNREQSSIYQVFVYGRRKGEVRPQWCHRVYLNQLERHLEQVNQILLAETSAVSQPGGVLVVSNESLARQGDPDAIARYLSETLSTLGVAVQVQVKQQNSTDTENGASQSNRLWVFCASGYTPDPSLIAEPVAQKLRSLNLSGYQDAVIAAQVQGESQPDWLLRVDLTPPEVMLKEWARWGDIQAIALLLSQKFAQLGIRINTSLQESTLHIFCTPINQALKTALAPGKELCLRVIASELEAIAPQGIIAASVYGQQTTQSQPEWIDWLNLPAQEHSSFQPSALELAGGGDEPAIVFLLERLLNPDLDARLRTGGLRVILLRKDDLLHIMCDAPVCPGRKRVCKPISKFLQQLGILGIAGVRIYGRRAGNKEPFWHYGLDFHSRQRLVPEATPEFAATSAHVGELIPIPDGEPFIRADATNQEVKNFVSGLARNWGRDARNFLLKTQLFTEIDQPQEQISIDKKYWVGLVWGSLGLLLTFHTDWLLSYIVARVPSSNPVITRVSASSPLSQESQSTTKTSLTNSSTDVKPVKEQVPGFNSSGFTSGDVSQKTILKASPRKKNPTTPALLAARNRKPSFNSRQLDEQLALYRQRLKINGQPPQVLIIGSSRALRGIDPVALSQGLATQGYTNIDVFNFGINGATVQVVDFILRHVLQPTELPKLIIWADGSRAFNSGREDATFKAIASSPGYKYALQQSADSTNKSLGVNNSFLATNNKFNPQNYDNINESLNNALAEFSSTYQNRDQLKQALNQTLTSLPVIKALSAPAQLSGDGNGQTEAQIVDFDGFLPLSTRFNPTEYYQKYSKVSGNYDSDYQSFQLLGIQDAALQSVLDFSQRQKITIVFVNMPLSTEYLDPVRTKYEQEFQQYMLGFAAHPNFVYRDLSQSWPQAYDFFSDPSHLNRYGAYEVSKKLANDPMIPWRKN